jgi:S1-C subfamily serine protease
VCSRGAGAAAGLQHGDVVVGAGGQRITSAADLGQVITASEPGAELDLTVVRGDRQLKLSVAVGRRPVRVGG